MQVTAPMIAYAIEHFHGIACEQGGSTTCAIERVRLYRGAATSPNTLYVIDPTNRLQQVVSSLPHEVVEQCAFLAAASTSADPEELLEYASDACAALVRWDASLKDALINDLTLPMIIELGEPFFSYPYAFVDKDLVTLAASKHYADHLSEPEARAVDDDPFEIARYDRSAAVERRHQTGLANDEIQLPPQRVRELVEDDEFFEVARYTEPFYYDSPVGPWTSYCTNLIEDGVWMVRLVYYIADGSRLHSGEEQLIGHYFNYVVAIYRRYTGAFESARSQSDALHTLLRDVLIGQHDIDQLPMGEALTLYGWKADNEYTLVKFVFFAGANWETAASYICRQLERQWRNSVALTLGHSIVWIFNHSLVQIKHHGGEFMTSVVHLMREHACKAGLSDAFNDFSHVRDYYYEAETALTLGQVRDPHFWYFNFSDYIFDYIANQATRQLGPQQVAHKGLVMLRSIDAEKGTDYVPTLKVYLENNQNAVRAAEQLFVHRTSLIRRIQRIERLTGMNLADSDEVAYIVLSYRMLGL